MLRSFSSPYLTPDDFSVPCRLRCSEESSSCDEDGRNDQTHRRQQLEQQPEEMSCTMRKWHRETLTSSKFISPHRRNSSKSQTKVNDAELILTPAFHFTQQRCLSGELSNKPIPLSKRFASFGTPEFIDQEDQAQCQNSWTNIQRQAGSKPQFKVAMTIPVNDIIKVLTRGEDDGKKQKNARKRGTSTSKKDMFLKEECRQPPTICITISSSRSYELLMESTNEQLVLMTFLKVNSTKGKVSFVAETDDEDSNGKRDNHISENSKNNSSDKRSGIVGESTQSAAAIEEFQFMAVESNPSNLTLGTAQSSAERSFDVEAFTAKRMAERLKTESLAEKLERRMHRLISSLDDLSSSFTKCACGCFGDLSVGNNTVVIEKETASRPRRNTASTVSLSDIDKLEVDPSMSTEYSTTRSAKPTVVGKITTGRARFHSGLSVESENHLLEEAPANGQNYYATQMRPSQLHPMVSVMAIDI